jgi:NAD dependent epimerase/dehydratase family enzyme
MVGAILHCINNSQISGPVNATAPNPVSNAQFSASLGAALNRPAVLPMPGFMVKLLFGEMGEELLLQGQYVLPNKLLASDYRFQYSELENALQQIVTA